MKIDATRIHLLLSIAIASNLVACTRQSVGSAQDPNAWPVIASAPAALSSAYNADIKAFCDGPNDPVVMKLKGDAGSMTLDRSQLVRIAALVVKPRLTTDDGRALFGSLASERIPPTVKASKLREQARVAGLSTCAFADIWDPPTSR